MNTLKRGIGVGPESPLPKTLKKCGRPGGDDLPFIYSSTLVVQDRGLPGCKRPGIPYRIGKIGKRCDLETEETLLQKENRPDGAASPRSCYRCVSS